MPVWTPAASLPFQSGTYPNQVIPRSDILLFIDNAKITYKEALAQYTTTPPTAVTQATSGTWSALAVLTRYDATIPNAIGYKIPILLQFNAVYLGSAAVANKLLFAWFDNNTQVGGVAAKYSANDLFNHAITLEKWLLPSGSGSIELRWQVEGAAPNVTFSMPNGFRLIGTPI